MFKKNLVVRFWLLNSNFLLKTPKLSNLETYLGIQFHQLGISIFEPNFHQSNHLPIQPSNHGLVGLQVRKCALWGLGSVGHCFD